MAERGASVVAISVDSVAISAKLADRLGISFPILTDADLTVIKAYGVAMVGMDIAVPATFVIRQDGTIAWRYVGERMDDRPYIITLLDVIDAARE